MQARELVCMTTPKQGNILPEGCLYIADNGRYGKGWPGYMPWYTWLKATVTRYGPPVFATAPDRVGDPYGTLADSLPWLGVVRRLAPVAFVAQDGCENGLIPWGQFDCLFIGGSTEWKLGPEAWGLSWEAKRRGLHVHVGRVNSLKRWHHALSMGADTVDGTFLAFGPDTNLPKVMAWTRASHQMTLEECLAGGSTQPHTTRPT